MVGKSYQRMARFGQASAQSAARFARRAESRCLSVLNLLCLLMLLAFGAGCQSETGMESGAPRSDGNLLSGVWRVDVDATRGLDVNQGSALHRIRRSLEAIVVDIDASGRTIKISALHDEPTIYVLSDIREVPGSQGRIFSSTLNGNPASFAFQDNRLRFSIPYKQIFLVLKRGL